MKNKLKQAQPYLFIVLVYFLGLIAYSNAINNSYVWDDDYYLLEDRNLRNLEGLRKIWFEVRARPQYYPVWHTSFWIEYHLWQLRPFGYHINNVLLHLLNAVLIWLILRRLNMAGAWLAALIFMAHPVHVESVAWITARKTVFSTFFYLASLLSYLRFCKDGSGRNHYLLSLILFICGLLTKASVCTLPAAILLILWWKRGRLGRREIVPTIPFFIAGIGLGMLTAFTEKYHVGALGMKWDMSIVDRMLVAGRALWFYAGKLLYPHKLTFIYPRWQLDPSAAWQYIFPIAALAVMLMLWKLRGRVGRGPLVAILYFAGTLFPALGFFNVYPMQFSFVADHFQYPASIGLITLFASGAALLIQSVQPRKRYASYTITAAIIMVLGVMTWHQSDVYENEKIFWEDTISKNPQAWIAYNNLGAIYEKEGNKEEAVALYKKAITLNPDYDDSYNNLGNIYYYTGKKKEAMALYMKAIKINPYNATSYYNLANCNLGLGDRVKAIAMYKEAIRIKPTYAEAHNNLGSAYYEMGKKEEAIALLNKAIAIDPDYATAYKNLCSAYYGLGQYDLAIMHCDKAKELGINNAALFKALMPYREYNAIAE